MSTNRNHRIPDTLWRAKTLAKRVERATEAYQAIYWRLTGTTAPIASERVKTTAMGNRNDALLVAGERRDRLKKLYDEAVQAAYLTINVIEDERYQDILINRYITGMSARDSAYAMHYSCGWERELHQLAIEAYKEAEKGARQ